MSRAASIALGLWLLAPPSAAARQGVDSPHGPLPSDLDCSACHTARGWSPLRVPLAFDHDERTGFRLTDAHARASCATCHLELRFDGPDIAMEDCGSCHADVHEGRMVRDCADCHDARSFHAVDGEAAHARTSFPLTGAHRQVSCESCHVNDVGGAYTPLETECTSCHAEEYRSAATVDHVANGYPTDCTECHSTLGWGDTPSFEHAAVSGGFVLLGAHDGLRCSRCHVIPGFELLFAPAGQDDCVACHADDYDAEHAAWGFPTTCLDCHTQAAWEPSTFDHDGYFLLSSGPHKEKWSSCSDCHTSPTDVTFFTCFNCHEHAQATMDDKHSEVQGYVWESGACLSCHPGGVR